MDQNSRRGWNEIFHHYCQAPRPILFFDYKYTNYDIMSTNFKKGVVKALADACKRYGIDFGIYYSLADWHHPDYATRYVGDPRPVSESVMPRYVQYMIDQLKELIEQ